MNPEAYCADILRVTEGEVFLSVGDKQLAQYLNPSYKTDICLGKGLSLPDLFSSTSIGNRTLFRLREVKFKLEERLVTKALEQLKSGLRQMQYLIPEAIVDRIEIVLPLKGRGLKKEEHKFLGTALNINRFILIGEDKEAITIGEGISYPVSILLL